jgi:hypothetical protein
MNVSVSGGRVIPADWDAVRELPESGLPPLTPEQRMVAQKMRIAEIDYARSAFAMQRTQDKLLAKTEAFARLLERRVREQDAAARIESVALQTTEHKFEVELLLNGRVIPLRIDEDLADDLLESGTTDADQRLERIINRMIPRRAA